MKAKLKNIFELLRQTIGEFGADSIPQQAASLAYYAIFSIAPLILVAVAVAGLVFGQQAAENQIVGQLEGAVGHDAATFIQTMVQNASRPGAGLLATVIGIFSLLSGAAGVFNQIKVTLNIIWAFKPDPKMTGIKGILFTLKSQVLSFGLVLATGLLLIVSLAMTTVLAAATTFLSSQVAVPPIAWEVLNFVISFVVITLLFAVGFKTLPETRPRPAWSDVWLGGALTSLLFTVGKVLIGLYLGQTGVTSAYGAAGSLVALLLWIYYSALIFFFGAEFTQVYAYKRGSRVAAKPGEVPVEATAPTSAAKSTPATSRSDAKMTRHESRESKTLQRVTTVEHIIKALSPIALLVARIAIMRESATGKKQRGRRVPGTDKQP